MEVPPTPPPMITQRAASGSSALGLTRRLEPGGVVGVGCCCEHALEVRPRVGLEVEVELGQRGLHNSPHRLAEVGHELHQAKRRNPPCRRWLREVSLEQVQLAAL